jgi:hypothetical protein
VKNMKKNNKISENFYSNALFTLNSKGCHCAIDTTNISPTEERKTFKVLALDDKDIRFAFEAGKGLARINIKTGAVEEEDILSSLVSIKDTNIMGYKNFFERNGFFFNISSDHFEQIDDVTLLLIINQMKVTLELLSQISDNQRKDYKKILQLTLYLLYSSPKILHIGDTEYKTCYHQKVNDALTKGSDQNNLYKIEIVDKLYYEIKDSIGTSRVHIDYYREITSDPSQVYNDYIKHIMHAYVNYTNAPLELREIIDFLYHVNFEIGEISGVNLDEISFNYSKPNWDAYTDELKSLTIKIAKLVTSEEINHNIQGIHPEYDYSIMEPRWKVDSLLYALYFSLFYMKPNMEITRLCANPKCGRYFTANRTSLKKKYCCPECANRANQNRYRTRIKA